MTPIEILAQTKRLVFEGWTKNTLVKFCEIEEGDSDNPKYCYCLEGACAVADGAKIKTNSGYSTISIRNRDPNGAPRNVGMLVKASMLSLEGEVAFEAMEKSLPGGSLQQGSLQQFNDRESTTKEMVVDLIDKAILKLTSPS